MQLLKEYLMSRIEAEPEYTEQVVKIGSQSGYFYCGTVKNFLENAAEYDGKIRHFFVMAVKYAEQRYEALLYNPPTIQDYAKEVLSKEDGRFCIGDYGKMLHSWFNALRKRYLAAEKISERRDKTKPLGEREVIDSFTADSTVDEGIEVIKVEGFEPRRLWMSPEVELYGEFTIGDGEEEEGNE